MIKIQNKETVQLIYASELTAEELKDMDYLSPTELCNNDFFRYRDNVYCLNDFITTTPGPWNHGLPEEFKEWDGYADDSYWSGTLVKKLDDDEVLVAQYFSEG